MAATALGSLAHDGLGIHATRSMDALMSSGLSLFATGTGSWPHSGLRPFTIWYRGTKRVRWQADTARNRVENRLSTRLIGKNTPASVIAKEQAPAANELTARILKEDI